MSVGNSPESLSQAILVGRILVGRLGISASVDSCPKGTPQKQNAGAASAVAHPAAVRRDMVLHRAFRARHLKHEM